MPKHLALLILVLIFPLTQTIGQKLDASLKKDISNRIEQYVTDYPGVSVSIIAGKSFVYRNTYGFSDIESKKSVTSETKFNIYSTSKFITGLAFLKLISEGKVDLDQKIISIDPGLPGPYSEITIRHLLTHTSGIRHYEGRKDWINFASLKCESPLDAMQYFTNDPLEAVPGEKEIYTTFGMVVASHILEKITGKTFEDAINDLLSFSTPLELDGENKSKATPYIVKKKEFKPFPDLNAKSKYGGGGFIASSDQLAQAGQMLFNEVLAPLEQTKLLCKEQWGEGKTNGMAFSTGAGISDESFGQADVLYAALGGGSPGGRSYLFVVADLEISVAITANLEGEGEDAYQLAMDIIKLMTGLK